MPLCLRACPLGSDCQGSDLGSATCEFMVTVDECFSLSFSHLWNGAIVRSSPHSHVCRESSYVKHSWDRTTDSPDHSVNSRCHYTVIISMYLVVSTISCPQDILSLRTRDSVILCGQRLLAGVIKLRILR